MGTTVILGKKNVPSSTMFYHFESEAAAYGFYANAKDSYAENDLFCEMVGGYADEIDEDEIDEDEIDEEPEYMSPPYDGYDYMYHGRPYNECLDREE